ncbi:MAG TPA: enoyl-CoA hydratase-related protein [Candidatus Limnocylindrales bacterium]|nr:enoyl-CoA hydratase-related protein [Candidatus Limnocylindrales bacterium]
MPTVHVEHDLDGRRARVTIDRTRVLNALDRATLLALRAAFTNLAADLRVGVVVLTGAGDRAFSTGADLGEQEAFFDRPNDYWAWMGAFIDAIDAIRDCPKPVVARLNGIVVGGGNELNLACDLAVAADDIHIRQIGPSRGSLPSGGATQWLPITIGDRRAREMLFLNRPIPAAEALDWGLVNRVVPRADLDAAVDDLSHELLAKLPETIRATKAQVQLWKDFAWSMTIRQAREWLTIHAGSAEVGEGLRAFREKALPDYEALREGLAATGTAQTVTSCPACGRMAPMADAAFCPYCGATLAPS